jgi:hypothetical protein
MQTADTYCRLCKVYWDLSDVPRAHSHRCWLCDAPLVEELANLKSGIADVGPSGEEQSVDQG